MNPASKLHYYHWRGSNQAGRKVSGVIIGYQEQEVRSKLTEQKIHIKKLNAVSLPPSVNSETK